MEDKGAFRNFFLIPARLKKRFVYNQGERSGNREKVLCSRYVSTDLRHLFLKRLSFTVIRLQMRWNRFIIFLVIASVATSVLLMDDAEAKRKKRRYSPPSLKILDISTSPMPFAPGNGPLAITVDVGLPKNLSNVDLLEVSSMISFPSKRSIRFLYNRHPIEDIVDAEGTRKISTTLMWDGKDQTNQLVTAGTYKYEIRAKLMSNKTGKSLVKVVSLRARGELEVSPSESLANRKRHLEHVPFTSEDDSSEDLGDGTTVENPAEVEELDADSISPQEENLEEVTIGDVSVPTPATPEEH